jgi:hypothetical protein
MKTYSMGLLFGLLTMFGGSSFLFGQQTGYKQTNLVANVAGVANHTDAQLTNPWGISFAGRDLSRSFELENQHSYSRCEESRKP